MKKILSAIMLVIGFTSLIWAADQGIMYKIVTHDNGDTDKVGVLMDRVPACCAWLGLTASATTTNADISVTNTSWVAVGLPVVFTNSVTNSVWISATVYGQAPASQVIQTALFVDNTEIAWGITSASEFSNLSMTGISGQLAPASHTVAVKAKVSAGTGLICADIGAASVPLVIAVMGAEGNLP